MPLLELGEVPQQRCLLAEVLEAVLADVKLVAGRVRLREGRVVPSVHLKLAKLHNLQGTRLGRGEMERAWERTGLKDGECRARGAQAVAHEQHCYPAKLQLLMAWPLRARGS